MKKLLLAVIIILMMTTTVYAEDMKIGGWLTITVTDPKGNVKVYGPIHNLVSDLGKTKLRDCFGGTGTPVCTDIQLFKFHGLGTSTTAVAGTQTACQVELTTKYTGNVRATGTQTNNGANIYRTAATNTIDEAGTISIEEFCLMSQAATGGGTMWTRILTGPITVDIGSSITTTYDLTIN